MPTHAELEKMRRMAVAFTRKMRGERPRVFLGGKSVEPANTYERGNFPSSDPMNVDFARRNGVSMKMVVPERIMSNRWYSNPEVQATYGHETPIPASEFKNEFLSRSSFPSVYQREMAQREYDQQVGRDVAQQIAQMRNVGQDGIIRDPRFIRYQAQVIKNRLYNKQQNNYISGAISTQDMLNTENYLKSASDEEIIRNYPWFFDPEKDGANFLTRFNRGDNFPEYRSYETSPELESQYPPRFNTMTGRPNYLDMNVYRMANEADQQRMLMEREEMNNAGIPNRAMSTQFDETSEF